MTLHITPEWVQGMRDDVNEAKHHIHVSALSMQPPRHRSITPHTRLMEALAVAAARGVRVCVWLAHPRPDVPATRANTGAAQWLVGRGIECRLSNDGHLLHAKSLCTDRRVLWIGSGNMTAAAAHHNHEVYMRTTDDASAMRWTSYLDALKLGRA
jgi:phosphatidylserine/phosphatidylglycerophosphate/cardiolipin synthase-like enzyme